MDSIAKFQYLSLISKVTTELDNHLEVNDKELAEFIVQLVDESESVSVHLRTPTSR